MLRFVVLHHEMPPGSARPTHWDFMLEAGEGLRVWALDREPAADCNIAAQPLADHRRAYLDYEGPISGDRGRVRRWDAGTYRIEREAGAELLVRLRGRRLHGTVTITSQEDGPGSWRYVVSTPPDEPERGP